MRLKIAAKTAMLLVVLLVSAVLTFQINACNRKPSSSTPPTSHPKIPIFTNFTTGANVKALAFEGEELWMGLSNGIIRYNTKTEDSHVVFTSRNTGGGLLSNGIYALKVDSGGTKWIGTYGGGLTKYDGENWFTFTPYGGGKTISYGNQWEIYPFGEGLGDLWVYDIDFDAEGNLWIATWKGVSKFDGKTFMTLTPEDGLIDQWVYAIAIDSEGVFWFGTEGGVNRYDGKEWESFTHADGLGVKVDATPDPAYQTPSPHHGAPDKIVARPNPNYVLDIAIDGKNHKWFGTWGAGLSRFDGKQWKTFTTADGLGGNFIHVLAIDPEGILWAGTDGGVSQYDGRHWKTYTTRDGLLDNNVFSIAFDDQGNKWFGTWTGLSKLDE